MLRRFGQFFGILLAVLAILMVSWWCYVSWCCQLEPPALPTDIAPIEITIMSDSSRIAENGWLHKSGAGFWEMYVSGEPYEIGRTASALYQDLLSEQEHAFVDGLEQHVPSSIKQSILLQIAAYYNRHLDDYIPKEYQLEIAGIAKYADSSFSYIGSNYARKLIYHGAHDVGHAFQNMGLVSGCSALGVQDTSGNLLLGRNFDFYIGDAFARNKIILAIRPTAGYPFLSVTWPGLIGVVSGMNTAGLCVALNAGPSTYPGAVRTPVTILAREIVQYAGNIEEAISIAKKRDVYVAENIIVGHSDEIVVIEKSPGMTVVHRPNPTTFACTNHFLSEANRSSEANLAALDATSTGQRLARIRELRSETRTSNTADVLGLLRNRFGADDNVLGNGNEAAINILNAHHSVVFDMSQKRMTVAGSPNQLATAYQYDVDDIFKHRFEAPGPLWQDTIAADPFYWSEEYRRFEAYKLEKAALFQAISASEQVARKRLQAFHSLNPQLYETYKIIGDYYQSIGKDSAARANYLKAIDLPIPWKTEREKIVRLLGH